MPSFNKGKILGLMLIAFSVLISGTLHAQHINWLKSYGQGTLTAKEKNKLILADFWAIWCVPCLKTDKAVWSNDTISSLTDNFVPVRFDVSNGWQNAEPFYVDVIPTIMIIDYRGEVLFKNESYKDASEMKAILSSFPEDVSELYKCLSRYTKNKKDHVNLRELAEAYQNAALESTPPAQEIFIDRSDRIFKKAKTACKKQKDQQGMDRINLLTSLNKIISGQPEKGTETVLDQLEKIGKESLSLAYYVLITGYLEQENPELAEQYYKKLKGSSGAEEYMKIVRSNFE